MELNDETLGAWLDGELEPAARAQVEAALASDTGARARLERLRQADRSLREALPMPAADPLLAAMARRLQSPPRTFRTVVQWAIAASVAGVMLGFLAGRNTGQSGFAAMDGVLQRVLDSQPAGITDAAGTQVLLSFQAGDGRYCRLFRKSEAAAHGEGLACRESTGWQLVAWDGQVSEITEGYRTAGASALIDGVMAAIGGEPALSAAEEAAVIDRDWRAQQAHAMQQLR